MAVSHFFDLFSSNAMIAGASMEVTLALLAKAANVSQEGTLNILGAFDTIAADEFPARHPHMELLIRCEASPAEYGSEKNFAIVLLDADGREVGRMEGTLSVPQAESGRRLVWGYIFPLDDVVFPYAGDYTFVIIVSGETKREVPLSVISL